MSKTSTAHGHGLYMASWPGSGSHALHHRADKLPKSLGRGRATDETPTEQHAARADRGGGGGGDESSAACRAMSPWGGSCRARAVVGESPRKAAFPPIPATRDAEIPRATAFRPPPHGGPTASPQAVSVHLGVHVGPHLHVGVTLGAACRERPVPSKL
ncbi:hypothetical protein GUJ93_ZPchr0007g5258 [Zizania palustris]|uniref:Uncharacterized protein n=1 Tax=Zizania palustris TaxID=103762 RepID=A0A8J5T137_ZIZPA|nr:hypothetical protein GUJ93_ZPchr0007g5258 [Zizania palustris]